MRAVLIVVLVGACGRFSFDDVPDAGSDSPAVAYAAVVLADQPRLYYRLDEAAGMPVLDATGNGNDTVFRSSPDGTITTSLPGATSDGNAAVQFDGVGNMIANSVAAVEVPVVGTTWMGDFTVELFFKPTQSPTPFDKDSMFLCEDYLNSGFRTGTDPLGQIHLWTDQSGATSEIYGDGFEAVSVGVWSHVAFVLRGARAEIYLDGVQITDQSIDYVSTNPARPPTECGVGAFHGMPGHGVYDEVAVYETALSPARIAAHFAAR